MGRVVPLTAAMVAEATGGRLVSGDPATVFAGVSTDTRTIRAGVLFIALRGDRFDAHDFVGDAVRKGASGVLVADPSAAALDAVAIVVPDTLQALQALARAVRRSSGARVVAITGSAGKTTTKEVTADLLSERFRVLRNPGNLNNHIGLPLSLLQLSDGYDVAVVELGMNHPGEIRTLVAIAEPDVRVWTNVGDAHVGHFGSREALADAKAEILENATARTVLAANADDPLVMARVARFEGRCVTFGESDRADMRATHVIDRGFDGVSARIVSSEGQVDIAVPLPGRMHLSNVLAAIVVASECGVPLNEVASGIARLHPVARRGSSVVLPRGARVIDDSYNASPAAFDAMLAALAATPVRGRRIVVVGEMLELGESSRSLHEASGRAAARAGVDLLVAIGGPVMDALVEGAVGGGLSVDRVMRFADSKTAAPSVDRLVAEGDIVVVKGSRGTRTDAVVDHLLAVA